MGVACVARAGWLGSGSKVGSVLRFCGCERGAKSCCKKLIEQLVEMKLSFKFAGKRGGSKNLRWSVLEHARDTHIYIYIFFFLIYHPITVITSTTSMPCCLPGRQLGQRGQGGG